MKSEDWVAGVVVVFAFGIGWMLGYIIGVQSTSSAMEREAIKLGHASYVVDDNGFPRFAWNQLGENE